MSALELDEESRRRIVLNRLLSGGTSRHRLNFSHIDRPQYPHSAPSPIERRDEGLRDEDINSNIENQSHSLLPVGTSRHRLNFSHADRPQRQSPPSPSIQLQDEDINSDLEDQSLASAHDRSTAMSPYAHEPEAQQDVQSLLHIPTIDIPPHERRQTPAQLRFPLYEYQKVCLTWLIQQEEDVIKRGSILAGKSFLSSYVIAFTRCTDISSSRWHGPRKDH